MDSLGPTEALAEHMILPGSWWTRSCSSFISEEGKSRKRGKCEERCEVGKTGHIWEVEHDFICWPFNRAYTPKKMSENFSMWRLNETPVTQLAIPFLKVPFLFMSLIILPCLISLLTWYLPNFLLLWSFRIIWAEKFINIFPASPLPRWKFYWVLFICTSQLISIVYAVWHQHICL